MSRAYLFDIGNVLVHFDFAPALRKLTERADVAGDEAQRRLLPLKDELESGLLSDVDFIARGMAAIGFRGGAEEFADIWSDIFSENEPMTPLVAQLAQEAPLYLLSNTSGLHKDYLFRRFPVFRHFTGGVYSHEARSMKPGEPIFRTAVESLQLDPARTFYIDDLAPNIATAQRLGFQCHHYGSARHHELVRQMENF